MTGRTAINFKWVKVRDVNSDFEVWDIVDTDTYLSTPPRGKGYSKDKIVDRSGSRLEGTMSDYLVQVLTNYSEFRRRKPRDLNVDMYQQLEDIRSLVTDNVINKLYRKYPIPALPCTVPTIKPITRTNERLIWVPTSNSDNNNPGIVWDLIPISESEHCKCPKGYKNEGMSRLQIITTRGISANGRYPDMLYVERAAYRHYYTQRVFDMIASYKELPSPDDVITFNI